MIVFTDRCSPFLFPGDDVRQGAAGEELQEQQARCPLLQQGEQQGFKLEQVLRDCFKEFVLCILQLLSKVTPPSHPAAVHIVMW